jgi:uncharacterized protein (DUF488 family)
VNVFTVGYQAGWTPERLQKAIDFIKATVVDVRLKPWSQDERWRLAALDQALTRYVHVEELGNVNYRGGSIRLKQSVVGLARVKRIIERGPVILLCACWNQETCHRTVVARMVAGEIGETQWMDLGRQKKKKPVPPQLGLFARPEGDWP